MWTQDEFIEIKHKLDFSEIPHDRIPIMQMELLRQLDFPITRGISYERTVYTFLSQVVMSSELNTFRLYNNAVILLNEEGAMIRRDGDWSLIFTPSASEGLTLGPDAPLYPQYLKVMEKAASGEMCEIPIENLSIRSLTNNTSMMNILDSYCKNYPGGYLAVAQKIVLEGTDELFSHVPVTHCGKLTTVDLGEREAYSSIMGLMEDYIYSVDHSDGENLRPLSISVFGSPGSGKSFGVKQIAKNFGRFSVYTLNLSQYSSYDEMIQALDVSLHDAARIPLIFFDEFDSEFNGMSRGWLKYLLAPMQDGEYTLEGKIHTIKNGVFVFAGGTASSFSQFQPSTPEEAAIFKKVKGPDFTSRLRGMLNIKGPNPCSVTDRSYIIRRAMLLRDLIIRKIPGIYDAETGVINMSDGLLSALLRVSSFRHGTRSMEFILDMSRLAGATRFTPSCLPMEDQMDIHLDYADFQNKLAFERIGGGNRFGPFVTDVHEKMCGRRMADAMKYGMSDERIDALLAQPDMRPWDELDELTREGYRQRTRAFIEGMCSLTFPVGIRPLTNGQSDTISEIYGLALNATTKLCHDVWRETLESDGWKYGPALDPAVKTRPDLKRYEDLDVDMRELLQQQMRVLPDFMKTVGLELYRKAL